MARIQAREVLEDHGDARGQAQGACPSCKSQAERSSIYSVNQVPIQSCVLLDTRAEALDYPRRDLELVVCRECGFIYNQIFDAEIVEYAATTEESQHYSGTFNAFAKRLAREISETVGIEGKHLLEIGCGKGDFLLELCSMAECTGLGIDPGFREQRLGARESGTAGRLKKLEFIADYFGPAYRHLRADLVLCRHTLEHIPNVNEFVSDILAMMSDQAGGTVFFETPDVKRVLEEGAFWDIYYEHCSYFTCETHAALFRRCGFEVSDVHLDYDDQYIIQYAHLGTGGAGSVSGSDSGVVELAEAFARSVPQRIDEWRRFVDERHCAGRRVALWGGGSKAVAFLTTLGLSEEVAGVVDINPFKQGKFLPGAGNEVIAPEKLRDLCPDTVIVMNPIYLPEIKASLNNMGLEPEVVAV